MRILCSLFSFTVDNIPYVFVVMGNLILCVIEDTPDLSLSLPSEVMFDPSMLGCLEAL